MPDVRPEKVRQHFVEETWTLGKSGNGVYPKNNCDWNRDSAYLPSYTIIHSTEVIGEHYSGFRSFRTLVIDRENTLK